MFKNAEVIWEIRAVKKAMLARRSRAQLGIFRGRRFKLGVQGDADPFEDSKLLLLKARKLFIGFMLDDEHSCIGEQVGVHREWIVEQLGEQEVCKLCAQSLQRMTALIEDGHRLWSAPFNASFEVPSIPDHQVLLESDIDPALPAKWGWVVGSSERGSRPTTR